MLLRTLFASLLFVSFALQAATLEELIDYAVCNHPKLLAEKERQEASGAAKKEARASFHPHLEAIGGHQEEDLSSRVDSYEYGYLELRWNLFRGGRDHALLKAASAEESLSHWEMEQSLQEVVKEIAIAFYRYLHCREKARIYSEAGAYLNEFAPMAQKKQDAGFETAVDGNEIQYHSFHYGAMVKQAEIETYLALTDLKFAVGGACQDEFEEIVCDFLPFEPLPPLDEVCQAAYCSRPERLIAGCKEKILAMEVQKAKGEYLPELDLVGIWGRENETRDERGSGTRALVEVKIPLYSGGASLYKKRKEQARLKEQQLLMRDLEQRIAKEVHSAYHRVESISAHLEVVDKIAAEKGAFLDAVRDEYKRGVRNSGDVVSSIAFMTEMEIKRFDDWRDYSIAKTELAFAQGDVLALFPCPNHSH